MSRVSATALALACVLVGYSLAGIRVSAKADTPPFRRLPYVVQQGDRVTLTLVPGSLPSGLTQVDCTLKDESAPWIRCGNGDSFSDKGEQTWYDLTRVVMIKKADI